MSTLSSLSLSLLVERAGDERSGERGDERSGERTGERSGERVCRGDVASGDLDARLILKVVNTDKSYF